jgi:hypothetical protein
MSVRYRVLKTGYMDRVTYDPNGKRPILVADKPLNPCPSWLQRITSKEEKQLEAAALVAATPLADVGDGAVVDLDDDVPDFTKDTPGVTTDGKITKEAGPGPVSL